jgi:hypothetical protein
MGMEFNYDGLIKSGLHLHPSFPFCGTGENFSTRTGRRNSVPPPAGVTNDRFIYAAPVLTGVKTFYEVINYKKEKVSLSRDFLEEIMGRFLCL